MGKPFNQTEVTMSRDSKQALTMVAGAVIGWLIGEYLVDNPAWELSCVVIGAVAGQFVFKLIASKHGAP